MRDKYPSSALKFYGKTYINMNIAGLQVYTILSDVNPIGFVFGRINGFRFSEVCPERQCQDPRPAPVLNIIWGKDGLLTSDIAEIAS